MKMFLQRLNEVEVTTFILAVATIAILLMIGNAIWKSVADISLGNYQLDNPRKTSEPMHGATHHRSPCPAAESDAMTV